MNSSTLERFVRAQAPVYDTVLAELRAGRKRSHWMWFIFPQIAGLGHSAMAQTYAIADLAEARAYLAHPVLGERLHECASLVAALTGRTADGIFGYPDNLKFHSSMTLFSIAAANDGSVFETCLQLYFNGQPDPQTVMRVSD
jgi:uncharacterized protein (DUF1810 family)